MFSLSFRDYFGSIGWHAPTWVQVATGIVAGLAVPDKHVGEMKREGMVVMVMTGKVQHALRAEAAGADIVAAQGTEAGGHTGEIGGIALVPRVVDAVSIPVLAAGGIVDGRGLVAALALGAQGAVVGTRFIATPEATLRGATSARLTARPAAISVVSPPRSTARSPAFW